MKVSEKTWEDDSLEFSHQEILFLLYETLKSHWGKGWIKLEPI